MKVVYKVWLDNNGKAFGEGPYELMQRIGETGSLHQAAKELKMSYRKAWLILHRCERKLGFPLLERTIGGISGGGSRVTPDAQTLILRYEKFRREVEKSLGKIFGKHFGGIFR